MVSAALPRHDEVRLAVIGLGYVGLPLAVGFGRVLETLGFDINEHRISELRAHRDHTLEITSAELEATSRLRFSADPADLATCNVFIVTVPTPIDDAKRPDLRPLESASRAVGRVIRPGGVAIYESTVYPGATEEVCVPILERESGSALQRRFLRRLQPRAHQSRRQAAPPGNHHEGHLRLDARSRRFRRCAVSADHHRRHPQGRVSIQVAEAAKVIENTQRDLNIALINELALIFNRLGIDTQRGAGGRRHQVEFPAVPARPGRRPLHRRRSLLPDPQGAGDRLPPAR